MVRHKDDDMNPIQTGQRIRELEKALEGELTPLSRHAIKAEIERLKHPTYAMESDTRHEHIHGTD